MHNKKYIYRYIYTCTHALHYLKALLDSVLFDFTPGSIDPIDCIEEIHCFFAISPADPWVVSMLVKAALSNCFL